MLKYEYAGFIILIGVIICFICVGIKRYNKAFHANAEKTTGHVTFIDIISKYEQAGFTFLLGAVICLILLGYKMNCEIFRANAEKTIAYVTHIDEETTTYRGVKHTYYTAYVTYTVDGVEYNTSFDYGTKLDEGDSVIIYYKETNPNRAMSTVEGNNKRFNGLIILSLLCACSGIFGYIKGKKKEKAHTSLD